MEEWCYFASVVFFNEEVDLSGLLRGRDRRIRARNGVALVVHNSLFVACSDHNARGNREECRSVIGELEREPMSWEHALVSQ